jgi:hypothetical protein
MQTTIPHPHNQSNSHGRKTGLTVEGQRPRADVNSCRRYCLGIRAADVIRCTAEDCDLWQYRLRERTA